MVIAALTAACEVNARMRARRMEMGQDARARRHLWLAAVEAGASRRQICDACGISPSVLESELKKAREESGHQAGEQHRGATYGKYPCPHPGCDRVGDNALTSAQGLGMHRMRTHGYSVQRAS